LAVDDTAFYSVVRSREYLSAEQFTAAAASLPAGDPPSGGIPILLSGIVAEPPDLLLRIAEAGGRVAADDLACGARRLYPDSDAADPFERMAERLMGSPPDPTRGSPIADRARMLADRMGRSGARGVIVLGVPFCEPELFDVPRLREHLKEAGYPLLHLEAELSESLSHQAVTRIEAFLEALA
jgi:benzoyl-CoA reductase/2-hydroxyglutaryl-CoA dehydratase subunit BcrC/BadD/HgdB